MFKSGRLIWALLAFGAAFLAAPAQAHKGNEHSEGCHTDRKTGDYHCHTPKTPRPGVEVAQSYCLVVREHDSCGHTRDQCELLAIQHGGRCERQLGFRIQ